jgi:CHAD domain-containing protein
MEFRSINGAENGRKMGKMAKIREILEKLHDSNATEIMFFGATDSLLKIETLAKMH